MEGSTSTTPSSEGDPWTSSSVTSISQHESGEKHGPARSALSHGVMLESLYSDLYNESHAAKLWRVGSEFLQRPDSLAEFPEYVPSSGSDAGRYRSKPSKFWTCGFFPGSLFTVLERSMRFPKATGVSATVQQRLQPQMMELCRSWLPPLRQNSLRTDTHDMGFILLPALRMDWELTGNNESLQAIITGANNLASRYSERTGAIRSWNQAKSNAYSITDMDKNFLIIIDSMCNMDLLFYAGHHTGNMTLIDKAISHAHVVRRSLIRPDGSTYHVANLDPETGEVQHQQTHQGYSDDSAWSRGQAWAILGFTQTYMWTKQAVFLDTAVTLANFFLERLAESKYPCPAVPLWDFTAPPCPAYPEGLRDTSAGMAAANGLLLLHQALQGQSPYLGAALRIMRDTRDYSLSADRARFNVEADGKLSVAPGRFDAILKHSTVNYNVNALVRYEDHGLVYADYYFMEFGNKLLRMGLV